MNISLKKGKLVIGLSTIICQDGKYIVIAIATITTQANLCLSIVASRVIPVHAEQLTTLTFGSMVWKSEVVRGLQVYLMTKKMIFAKIMMLQQNAKMLVGKDVAKILRI